MRRVLDACSALARCAASTLPERTLRKMTLEDLLCRPACMARSRLLVRGPVVDHIGHAIEKTLWALLMLMLSVAFGAAALRAHALRRIMLIAGFLVYGVGAGLTVGLRREDVHPPVPWMTLYFSIGVWTSVLMVVLEGTALPM